MNNRLLKAQQAIGVFDSGVGGLSVLKQIHQLLPNERLIYVADSQHAPYGNQAEREIQKRCFAVADLLVHQRVKALVVACNTATAAVISHMRAHYDLPIIGMEPAVKPAVTQTKNGKVGVLATAGTLNSTQFSALLTSYGQQVEVTTQACEGLVELVERGEFGDETKALLQRYCKPLIDAGVDTVVLGCTHYPFVKALIRQVMGSGVQLIDTGEPVAKQLQRRLISKNLINQEPLVDSQAIEFITNNQSLDAESVMQALWGDMDNTTFNQQVF